MFAWFAKLLRSRAGTAAVETALAMPMLLILMAGIIDVGRGLYQASAVEKGLRMGALFLARSDLPITQATLDDATALIKTGGTSYYLVSGWAEAGADVQITTQNFLVGGTVVPVFELRATVPFDPLFTDLIPGLDLSTYMIRLTHEQAYVGL